MCVFCAAIPVAAATGFKLNANQLEARRKEPSAAGTPSNDETSGIELAPPRPILKVTAGVVVLLLIGSVTYHTLTYLP